MTEMQIAFKGEMGELPTPEMDGFNFVGWYNELGDEITEFTIADMVAVLQGTDKRIE